MHMFRNYSKRIQSLLTGVLQSELNHWVNFLFLALAFNTDSENTKNLSTQTPERVSSFIHLCIFIYS